MGNGAVKTIVLLMVLVVLSFVVGAQVSDGMKNSLGAFVLIGVIGLGFVLLLLGERSMMLLLALPCIFYDFYVLPFLSSYRFYPFNYVFPGVIFAYAVLMWVMRYVRFRWRGVLVLDVLVCIITLYYIGNYIAYPTAVNAMSVNAEYVGGREYIWLALALIYYVSVSSVAFPAKSVPKLIRRVFFLSVWGHVLFAVALLASGQLGTMVRNAAAGDGVRFTLFDYVAPLCTYYCYSSAPISRLLCSLRHWSVLSICSLMVLLGGRREIFLAMALAVAFLAFLKREFSVILVVVLFLYAGLWSLSSQHVLLNAPHSVQRVLSVVPGMEISRSIEQGTQGSSETRKEIWRYGLDPRTGFIKNYIWGDGFRTETAYLQRSSVGAMRALSQGRSVYAGERQAYVFARGGLWHNGFIYTIHHTGVVGLVLVICFFIVGMVMIYAVSCAYAGTQYYPAIMAMSLPWAAVALSYAWGSGDLSYFFSAWTFLGIIKLLYCAARERGLLRPLFQRDQYVPMTIRDIESAA